MAKFKRTLNFFEYWFVDENKQKVNFDFKDWLATSFNALPIIDKHAKDYCRIQKSNSIEDRNQCMWVEPFGALDQDQRMLFIRWANISKEYVNLQMNKSFEVVIDSKKDAADHMDTSHLILIADTKRGIICRSNTTPGGFAFIKYINKLLKITKKDVQMRFGWMVNQSEYKDGDVIKKVVFKGSSIAKDKKDEKESKPTILGNAIQGFCEEMGLCDGDIKYQITISTVKRTKAQNLVHNATKFAEKIEGSPREERVSFVKLVDDKYSDILDLYLKRISHSIEIEAARTTISTVRQYDWVFYNASMDEYVDLFEQKWDNELIRKLTSES